MSLTPDEGARILLERKSVSGGSASYQVSVILPEQELNGAFELALEGEIPDAEWSNGQPPQWVAPYLRTIVRQLRSSRLNSPREQWPFRILRWREAKS